MQAFSTSWRCEPFKQGVSLPYYAAFDNDQFALVKEGFIPQVMEDKWFIYYEEPHLLFHRSWTGRPVYRLALRKVQMGAEVTEALLSTGRAGMSRISFDYEVQVLDCLVSSFFLGQPKLFPAQPPLQLPMNAVVFGTLYAASTEKPKKPWWRVW